jgi:hypothetical protein
MNIWDATFKEKAAGDRVDLGDLLEDGADGGAEWRFPIMCNARAAARGHRPEACTSRAAPAPRSGYPIQIVSNRLLARIFVTGNTFTEN